VLIDEGESQRSIFGNPIFDRSSPYQICGELWLTIPRAEDARRYFKQSEIVLFRQAPDGLTPPEPQQSEITPA